MTISISTRHFVRQRARLVCEYCGVHEADAGNQLTIDHFCPRVKGGDDSLENLIYCCPYCNQYKHDYWSDSLTEPQVWNPRREPFSLHFFELDDGLLHPLTETGAFTLRLLHLNRPMLVAYRLKKQKAQIQAQSLAQLQALAQIYQQLVEQQAKLITEQHGLLEAQRDLLRRIFESNP